MPDAKQVQNNNLQEFKQVPKNRIGICGMEIFPDSYPTRDRLPPVMKALIYKFAGYPALSIMFMKLKCLSIIAILLMLLPRLASAQTKLYLVPSLHGLHKTNSQYTYDSLKTIIAHLTPDIIAVEIRAEDIDADTAYLAKNYPLEMRSMKYWFPAAAIKGFDWLGDDIKGKPIPPDYWKEISAIKKYERALDEDSFFNKRTMACDSFSKKRLELLQKLSLRELVASDDAGLTNQFYSCLENALDGSIHERVLDFYEKRNRKILKNIKRLVRRNKGNTIVVVTGDDHYVYLKTRIPHQPIFK